MSKTTVNTKKNVCCSLGVLLMAAAMLLLLSVGASAKDRDGKLVIVSMGDSYSSGEGNEPFYGQNVNGTILSRSEKILRNDWLSHRSENAWPGKLKFSTLEGTTKNYFVDLDSGEAVGNWYFVAASGAQTFNINSHALDDEAKTGSAWEMIEKVTDGYSASNDYRQRKNIVMGFKDKLSMERKSLPYQTDILLSIAHKGISADYVTISVGGNDVGFAGIVSAAVTNVYFLASAKKFVTEVTDFWKGVFDSLFHWENRFDMMDFDYIARNEVAAKVRDLKDEYLYDNTANGNPILYNRLKNTYGSIIDLAANKNIRIIVLGYPRLLDPDGGGTFFTRDEALAVDSACEEYDNWLRMSISDIDEELHDEHPEWEGSVYYASVLDEFGLTHTANNKSGDPWLNPLQFASDTISQNLKDNLYKYLIFSKPTPGSLTMDVLNIAKDYIGDIETNQELLGWGENAGPGDIIPALLVSSYCVHPNAKGIEAYAACAQNKIEDVECSLRGQVVDIETEEPIAGAHVKLYRCEEIAEEDGARSFTFLEQLWNFYDSVVNKKDHTNDDERYANAEADETNLLGEFTTDSDGYYEALLLPELEEEELLEIKVTAGGYAPITFYTIPKRLADCDNTKAVVASQRVNRAAGNAVTPEEYRELGYVVWVDEDSVHDPDEIFDNDYYRFNFAMEEQDVEKMLCGVWQSNSFHWTLSSMMEIYDDGTCSLDYLPLYNWYVEDNIITFEDQLGAGMIMSLEFEVTDDKLILYNPYLKNPVDSSETGEKAVYYRQD